MSKSSAAAASSAEILGVNYHKLYTGEDVLLAMDALNAEDRIERKDDRAGLLMKGLDVFRVGGRAVFQLRACPDIKNRGFNDALKSQIEKVRAEAEKFMSEEAKSGEGINLYPLEIQVPYNVNGNHWVGLTFQVDKNSDANFKTTCRTFDPQGDYMFGEKAYEKQVFEKLFQEHFPGNILYVDVRTPSSYGRTRVQIGGVACGAFTAEIFTNLRKGLPYYEGMLTEEKLAEKADDLYWGEEFLKLEDDPLTCKSQKNTGLALSKARSRLFNERDKALRNKIDGLVESFKGKESRELREFRSDIQFVSQFKLDEAADNLARNAMQVADEQIGYLAEVGHVISIDENAQLNAKVNASKAIRSFLAMSTKEEFQARMEEVRKIIAQDLGIETLLCKKNTNYLIFDDSNASRFAVIFMKEAFEQCHKFINSKDLTNSVEVAESFQEINRIVNPQHFPEFNLVIKQSLISRIDNIFLGGVFQKLKSVRDGLVRSSQKAFNVQLAVTHSENTEFSRQKTQNLIPYLKEFLSEINNLDLSHPIIAKSKNNLETLIAFVSNISDEVLKISVVQVIYIAKKVLSDALDFEEYKFANSLQRFGVGITVQDCFNHKNAIELMGDRVGKPLASFVAAGALPNLAASAAAAEFVEPVAVLPRIDDKKSLIDYLKEVKFLEKLSPEFPGLTQEIIEGELKHIEDVLKKEENARSEALQKKLIPSSPASQPISTPPLLQLEAKSFMGPTKWNRVDETPKTGNPISITIERPSSSPENPVAQLAVSVVVVRHESETNIINFKGTLRSNKFRRLEWVAELLYEDGISLADVMASVVIQAVAKVNADLSQEKKIDTSEKLQEMINYAMAYGGFSNVVEKDGEKTSYTKGIPHDIKDPEKFQIWQKISKLIQEGNAAVGIYTGREDGDGKRAAKKVKTGLRSTFAFDILTNIGKEKSEFNLAAFATNPTNLQKAEENIRAAKKKVAEKLGDLGGGGRG